MKEKKFPYQIDAAAFIYYRTKANISQRDLAKKLDINQSAISKYENEVVKGMTEEMIKSVASIFGCTKEDLQTPASRKLSISRQVYMLKQAAKIMEDDGMLDVTSAADVLKLYESNLEVMPNEEEELSEEHEEALKSAAVAGSDYTEKFKGPGVPEE